MTSICTIFSFLDYHCRVIQETILRTITFRNAQVLLNPSGRASSHNHQNNSSHLSQGTRASIAPVKMLTMSQINVQVMSGLHLEMGRYDTFAIPAKVPYLALLGDIGCVKDEGYCSFLERQLTHFEVVFLILSNADRTTATRPLQRKR